MEFNYEIIRNDKELDAVIEAITNVKIESPLDVPVTDIETRPGHPKQQANDRFTCKLAGLGLSWAEDTACYIPLDHDDGDTFHPDGITDNITTYVLNKLRPIYETLEWANHGAKFDWGVLKQPRFGVRVNYQYCSYVEAILTGKFYDLFKFEQGGSDAGLGSIVLRLFGYKMGDIVELGGVDSQGRVDPGILSAETAAFYTCDDGNFARKTHRVLWPKVKDMFLYKVEMPLFKYVELMEEVGLPFNKDICKMQLDRVQEFVPKARRLIFDQAERQLGYRPEVNLDSPKKVAHFFYDPKPAGLGYPCTQFSKKTKDPAVNAKALAKLVKDFDLVFNYQTYKKLVKADTGFLSTLPNYVNAVTNLLHCTYHQGGVPTGRLASSNPNGQNFSKPKEYVIKDGELREVLSVNVRDAVAVAEDELLYIHDNKAVEFWIACEYGKENFILEQMIKGFDPHVGTACQLYNLQPEMVDNTFRDKAKTRNYAMIYGETAEGYAEKEGISVEEAYEDFEEYFRKLPGIAAHRESVIAWAKNKLYVQTHFGRFVDLESLLTHPDRKVRAHGERFAYNAVMQGTGADIAKIQWVRLGQLLTKFFTIVDGRETLPLCHQGHDALAHWLRPRYFNMHTLPKYHEMVKKTIEFDVPGFKLPVRTDAKVGRTYGTMVDYNGEPYEEILEKIKDKEKKRKNIVQEIEQSVLASPAEHVLIAPDRPLTREELMALKTLLQRNPGNNIVYLTMGDTVLPIESYPTSLSLKDNSKFQMVLPCKVVARRPADILGDITKAAMA